MQAIKSGTLSQMPWTDLPFGLSRDCSSETEMQMAGHAKRLHYFLAD